MSLTPEQALQAAEVLKAYAEGKRIEYRIIGLSESAWSINTHPQFRFDTYEYRVAPPSKADIVASVLVENEQLYLYQIKNILQSYISVHNYSEQEIKDALDIYFGLN